jgi:hypothetical protein
MPLPACPAGWKNGWPGKSRGSIFDNLVKSQKTTFQEAGNPAT